jgi:hypothetical protein
MLRYVIDKYGAGAAFAAIATAFRAGQSRDVPQVIK